MPVATLPSSRNIGEDSALPTLRLALDPTLAAAAVVDSLDLGHAEARLCSIQVMTYKPGRRCLIEYRLEVTGPRGTRNGMTVLGKIRTKRFGNSGYRQLRALWEAGFDDRSSDGISVPEPLGTIPSFRMWLQRKVAGALATDLLESSGSPDLASRIAEAVQKLHTAAITAERRHTIDHELQILERCLAHTAKVHPDATPRLLRLVDVAGRVGGTLPAPEWCPSHRDFYADQVLVSNDRLFLIDFDLFCEADPGLDIGNFLGHVVEQAVRVHGSPDGLALVERTLEDQFVARAGEGVRWAVRVYTALTLARHVYLCIRSAERAHLMPTLLAVAQDRLDKTAAEGGHA